MIKPIVLLAAALIIAAPSFANAPQVGVVYEAHTGPDLPISRLAAEIDPRILEALLRWVVRRSA
jgi:hypothetical protein